MSLNEEERVLVELLQRQRLAEINNQPSDRQRLEEEYGQVWNTEEVQQDFQILGFRAPFAVCKRRADGVLGSLEFQHNPRFYFNFLPDTQK